MKKLLAMIVTGFLLFANPTTASAGISINNTPTNSISSKQLSDYIDSKTELNKTKNTFYSISNVLLVTFSVIFVIGMLVAAGSNSSSN
jgi:hypothetical protein